MARKRYVTSIGNIIYREIVNDFVKIHLTGNLTGTMIYTKSNTYAEIIIPAKPYPKPPYIKLPAGYVWLKDNSYAWYVNATGGLSAEHSNYIYKAIVKAVILSYPTKKKMWNSRKLQQIVYEANMQALANAK